MEFVLDIETVTTDFAGDAVLQQYRIETDEHPFRNRSSQRITGVVK